MVFFFNKYLYFFISLLFFVSACSTKESKVDDQWYKDEILSQIKELKSEVRSLRREVVNLKLPSGEKKSQVPLSVSVSGAPSINDHSNIAIVEFSDFQCPYCARHDRKVFPELKEKYLDSGILRYVARDFPLGFHAQARPAAMAAHCAGDQGKYWEMRHYLFSNRSFSREIFIQGAIQLELDSKEFSQCIDEDKHLGRVEDDFAYGQRIGVNGTPRFFIGRINDDKLVDIVPLSGAQPLSAFERVINKFLKD
ncbi:DsbA family protein [Microbulbifer sp. JMSA003]|uniref:DsbA family protein n=1 Tax=Microbulbifer sp. JMSA003 TaxID=3243369 RepID=UPI004039E998